MTKTLLTALLLAVSLSACSKQPSATDAVQETIAYKDKAASVSKNPARLSELPANVPSDFFSAQHPSPVTHPADASSQASSNTHGGTTPEGTGATPPAQTTGASTLAITTAPTDAFRVFPLFRDNKLLGARFSPADAMATWQLKVSHGSIALGKIIFSLQEPDGKAVTAEAEPRAMSWPAKLSDTQSLALPLDANFLLNYLGEHVEAKTLTLSFALQDAKGDPVLGANQQPFQAAVQLEVL